MEAYHEKRRESNEKFEKNVKAKKANVRKKIEGVKKLREKYGHESTHIFNQFSKKECSTYLQYKKQSNKDPGMPRDLEERRARCIEWMTRPSPTASPAASDDEGEIQLDVMDCVDGLMEFATQAGTEWDNTVQEGDI